MKLIALEIPDDPADLAGWLERQLVGLDLAALVAELEAVHGRAVAAQPVLGDVLGDHRDAVLAGGLSALRPGGLRALLHQPRLLLGLQELVLTEGGDYWRQLAGQSEEHRAAIARGRSALARITTAESSKRTPEQGILPLTRPTAWFQRPWVVSLATAATVFVAVVFYDRPRPGPQVSVAAAPSGWGWNRSGALPRDVPPAEYLSKLADAASEWFKKRPEGAAALAQRIAEFRQGCSVLIFSEHRPLSPDDRTWLVVKCRTWAAKLDAHLAAVEAGEDPSKVRAEADDTIDKLIRALRERAKSLS